MRRPGRPRTTLAIVFAATAVGVTACGEKGIQLSSSDPDYEGAKIFQQHCSGCHTINAAGTEGSAVDANNREIVDGPNFNQRKEEKDQVLYAIRNGGFSSGPMPQDIVVGEAADKVADFVAKYSGDDIPSNVPEPGAEPPAGAGGNSSSSPAD
jgi:mono/diheme cytochrome c family protein